MTIQSDTENFLLDWEVGKNNNFVGIGYPKLGDLTYYNSKERIKILKEKLNREYKPDKLGALKNWASDINSFINRIDIDDIVFLPMYDTPDHYTKKYMLGSITSKPYYDEMSQDKAISKNRRSVKWLNDITIDRLSPKLKRSLESPHTVYNIDKHYKEIQILLRTI